MSKWDLSEGGAPLDAEIARVVFGRPVEVTTCCDMQCGVYANYTDVPKAESAVPSYSTDDVDACALVCYLGAQGCQISIDADDDQFCCKFTRNAVDYRDWVRGSSRHAEFPLAVCYASLALFRGVQHE